MEYCAKSKFDLDLAQYYIEDMIKRTITNTCIELFNQYPIITITGPRQSGKTTLARNIFPDKPYVNLEFPNLRSFAINDPRGFLNNYPDGAILDEVQRVPELPSYLQGIVDEKKRNGLFVLTGSQQLEISQSITQSLAGRTAMIKLLPLSIEELLTFSPAETCTAMMFKGFYPGLHAHSIQPHHFYANYFETYLERDLRQLTLIENLTLFEKFVRLLAARAGNLLNNQGIANDCGVTQPTVRKWVTLLEASYIVFELPPFFRTIGKRLIKTPKIYFYDTGLLCFLLGIETEAHLASHPLRGAIFENCMVMELLKRRLNRAMRSNLFFYRDRAGNEIDVIAENGSTLLPIEIKASQTSTIDFFKGLRLFKALYPQEVHNGLVVYDGEAEPEIDICRFINWKNLDRAMNKTEKNDIEMLQETGEIDGTPEK